MFKKIVIYIVCFALGICSTFIFFKGSREKLTTELQSAKFSLESAARINSDNTKRIQDLSRELIKSDNIVAEQSKIINNQQQRLAEQERIIKGIINNISGQGSEIGNKIQSIADGFRQLYNSYYESTGRK